MKVHMFSATRFAVIVLSLIVVTSAAGVKAAEGDYSFVSNRLVRSCDGSSGCDPEPSDCGCTTCDGCCGDCCHTIFGPGWLIPDLSESSRKSLADKHAPAGIMGDHVHHRGEWMFEYKYMNMYMEDNRIGTNSVPDLATFGFDGTNILATPTQMTMEMHMMHIMYGLTDSVTLYAMPMWKSLTMDHLRNPMGFPPNPPLAGVPFTTHNSGFADLTLGAMWQFHETECDQWIFNFAFSVPTGDIDRTTRIPTGGVLAQEFPYPMRLGSGSFHFKPAITYKRFFNHGSFGAQFEADIPAGRNDQNYSIGEDFKLNAWYAHLLRDWIALSFRVEGNWRNNYDGADADLPQLIISTNRPDMRGGEWLRFGYGAMVLLEGGHLINAEIVHPVYQNLDGVQLEDDWRFVVSWSKAFGPRKKCCHGH